MTGAAPVILRTVKLTKSYRHAEGVVHALRDVDLSIAPGTFLAITGGSGAGKSTLLLLLGGLLRPTSGEIWFRETPLHELDDAKLAAFRRDHVGYVMQNFCLVPYLSAAENVAVPMLLTKRPRVERRAKSAALLDAVGLGSRASHLPRELSVGQQQRVAIARALANDPSVLFADEPTGNLDPELAEDILGLLGRIHREKGTTIAMVTHSPGAATRGTARVHLKDGCVVSVPAPRPAAVLT